jgi:hypothetical protein
MSTIQAWTMDFISSFPDWISSLISFRFMFTWLPSWPAFLGWFSSQHPSWLGWLLPNLNSVTRVSKCE